MEHCAPDLHPLRAVVFDFDGTLVNTLPDIAWALNRVLVEESRAELAEAETAVMVGDNANDVAAARAAGVPVMLVGYGYSTSPVGTLGADALIDDFGELRDALARIAGEMRRRGNT